MRQHAHIAQALYIFLPLLPVAVAGSAAEAGSGDAAKPAVVKRERIADFLRPYERIVLKLGWGIFTRAGETTFETIPFESPEGPRVRVHVTTNSTGLVDAVYPLSNDSVSIIDAETARPLRIETKGREGSRETHTTTIFNYETGMIEHTDHIRPQRSGTTKIPDEPVYDLMVTMMKVRDWDLKPGEVRKVRTAFADDIYDLELHVLRQDRVKTPAGTFETVEIEPRQVGELKGFFRKGGSMKFFISRAPEPQIVRMDVKTKLGTITGTLLEDTKIEPPDADTRS